MAAAVAACAVAGTALIPAGAQAALDGGPTYTVTVGATGSGPPSTDTPAFPYLDKDGTYYHQQSAALYGANSRRYWDFYTGTNIDNAKRSSAISDAVNPNDSSDRNNNTTTRCNNSPTGRKSTADPSGRYSQRNFCDLAGVWVDPDSGNWYGLVHNEFTGSPFGDGLHYDAIDYAVSTDQGKTWKIQDQVLTSPFSTVRGDTRAFPNETYHYGDGDQRLYVDAASGYFYVFYGSRIVDKRGTWQSFQSHVARAPISQKMAPGSWRKWYNGSWSEPGAGGRESSLTPVTNLSQTGYQPTSLNYNPANSGTAQQQIAAGRLAPTSPLFVMDITWNAYLGMYIGQPQNVNQNSDSPSAQEYYGTTDLTTQKWTLLGNTGSYRTTSWYRWFIDSANKTGNMYVGRDFRSYCYVSCSRGSSEYVPVRINSSAGPDAPVDISRTYRIAAGDGRVLTQNPGTSATSSQPAGSAGANVWQFAAVGDGSYTITNTATGNRLGVGTSTGNRAWGTRPTASAVATGAGGVGQQWWVIRERSSSNNAPTGAVRLINRHSQLALNLTSASGRTAETAPVRAWSDSSNSQVGRGRSADQQRLSLTAVGSSG